MKVDFSSIKTQVSNVCNSVSESTTYLCRKVSPYVPATLGTAAASCHLLLAYDSPNFRCFPDSATFTRGTDETVTQFVTAKFSNMASCMVDIACIKDKVSNVATCMGDVGVGTTRVIFSIAGGLAITAALTVLLMRHTNPVNESDEIENEETSPDAVSEETTAKETPVAKEQNEVSTKVEADGGIAK